MKNSIFLLILLLLTFPINIKSQWQPDVRLTNDTAASYTSQNNAWCITANGDAVHVVWSDERNGNFEMYYKRSTDRGVSWGGDTRLTNNSGVSGGTSVTVSGSAVHVVWQDNRDGNDEIYYKRSTDGGAGWGTDSRLTNDSASSENPSIAVSGQVVDVVWNDRRDGNPEIYYKRSTDAGVSWGTDSRLTNNSANSDHPSISVSGQVVHVVWYDFRDGNLEIYYKRSTDGGASWEADTRLTNNSADSYFPSASVSGSVVHVVWFDERDGNYEIYYKRDPTGNSIGIINISTEIPKAFSLSQNYPNPFNPATKIRFQIPKSGFVHLVVYDVLGREIAALVDENLQPGTYEADWDAANQPSGVYYYKLIAGNYSETKKMVLVK